MIWSDISIETIYLFCGGRSQTRSRRPDGARGVEAAALRVAIPSRRWSPQGTSLEVWTSSWNAQRSRAVTARHRRRQQNAGPKLNWIAYMQGRNHDCEVGVRSRARKREGEWNGVEREGEEGEGMEMEEGRQRSATPNDRLIAYYAYKDRISFQPNKGAFTSLQQNWTELSWADLTISVNFSSLAALLADLQRSDREY